MHGRLRKKRSKTFHRCRQLRGRHQRPAIGTVKNRHPTHKINGRLTLYHYHHMFPTWPKKNGIISKSSCRAPMRRVAAPVSQPACSLKAETASRPANKVGYKVADALEDLTT